MSSRNLRTVQQFCDENPAFTHGALRWHIFNSKINGLDSKGVIVRVRRRVYIDVDQFFEWLDSQQGSA